MSKQKPLHKWLDDYHIKPCEAQLLRAFSAPEDKPFERAGYMSQMRVRGEDWEARETFSRNGNKSWKERRKTQYRSEGRKVQEFLLKFEIKNPVEQNTASQFATGDEWKETPQIRHLRSDGVKHEEKFPEAVIHWTDVAIEPENPNVEIHRVKIYGNEKTDAIYELVQKNKINRWHQRGQLISVETVK